MIDQDKVAIDNEISRIQAIPQMGEQESTIEKDFVDWWAKEYDIDFGFYLSALSGDYEIETLEMDRYAEYRGWIQKGQDNFQIVQTEESM
tara:strand:+ start:1282 stop:1551 length:270 start_codon:yes stop_codon:yes gene_type:complete